MAEAIRVYARYDIEDDDGRTRRQRNEEKNIESPSFQIPEHGQYLWDWWNHLNESVSRISDGICRLLPPTEIIAWCQLTGNIVKPVEYDILRAMDEAFCKETNLEFQAIRSKREAAQMKAIEDAKTGKKGG